MLITQIFYEDGIFPCITGITEHSQFDGREWWYVNEAVAIIKPLGIIQSGTGRLVIDVNTQVGTINTVGTVNTVSTMINQTNIGGLNALDMQFNMACSWNTGIRNNITF
jgi:hypothetical protein